MPSFELTNFSAGYPAIAPDVNANFTAIVEEINNFGTYGSLAADVVDTVNIKDDAVTNAKLSLRTPTSDLEPATKGYVDTALTGFVAGLFGSYRFTDSESADLAFSTSSWDAGTSLFLYDKHYQAECDGFLILHLSNDDDIFVVVFMNALESPIIAACCDTTAVDTGTASVIAIHKQDFSTAHIGQTLTVPIKKGAYVKIHASEYGSSTVGTVITEIAWLPFGSGNLIAVSEGA